MYLTINEYNSISEQNENLQNDQNNSINQFENRNQVYYENQNKKLLKRNSIINEDDQLIHQNEGGSSDEQDLQRVSIFSPKNKKNVNLANIPLTRGRSRNRKVRNNRIEDFQSNAQSSQKQNTITYETKDLLYKVLC